MYFVVLGCLHQFEKTTGVRILKYKYIYIYIYIYKISFRIAIICDIVPYSQADVSDRFELLLHLALHIQNEWSGEWYCDHSPSDVMAKMHGAILHYTCTFKAWYLSDHKGKFDLTLENIPC